MAPLLLCSKVTSSEKPLLKLSLSPFFTCLIAFHSTCLYPATHQLSTCPGLRVPLQLWGHLVPCCLPTAGPKSGPQQASGETWSLNERDDLDPRDLRPIPGPHPQHGDLWGCLGPALQAVSELGNRDPRREGAVRGSGRGAPGRRDGSAEVPWQHSSGR